MKYRQHNFSMEVGHQVEEVTHLCQYNERCSYVFPVSIHCIKHFICTMEGENINIILLVEENVDKEQYCI
jgi:hypothetical protein